MESEEAVRAAKGPRVAGLRTLSRPRVKRMLRSPTSGDIREEGLDQRVDVVEDLGLDRLDVHLLLAQALDEEDELDDVEGREQPVVEDRLRRSRESRSAAAPDRSRIQPRSSSRMVFSSIREVGVRPRAGPPSRK